MTPADYADGMLAKTESTLDHGLDEMTERGVYLTDHAFRRLAQLGFVTLIVLAGALVFAMRFRPVRQGLQVAAATVDSDGLSSSRSRDRNTAA